MRTHSFLTWLFLTFLNVTQNGDNGEKYKQPYQQRCCWVVFPTCTVKTHSWANRHARSRVRQAWGTHVFRLMLKHSLTWMTLNYWVKWCTFWCCNTLEILHYVVDWGLNQSERCYLTKTSMDGIDWCDLYRKLNDSRSINETSHAYLVKYLYNIYNIFKILNI